MSNFTSAFMTDLDYHLEKFTNMFTIRTKYGAMAATAIPIVILAGIYVAWPRMRRACKGPKKGRCLLSRSISLGALHGGKLAVERLIDYHHARADASTLDAAETDLDFLLHEDHPDFKKLQCIIAKLEMSSKEAIAIEKLEKAMARNAGKSHEAYEIGMLLVEMYIYKGDFEKALNCKCLTHKEISDARRPLYKAILNIMLKKREEDAIKEWEEFRDMRSHFITASGSEACQLHKVITDFKEFEKVVNSLKTDIEETREKIKKKQHTLHKAARYKKGKDNPATQGKHCCNHTQCNY